MTQTRLHFTTGSARPTRIFAALERAFEDDGFPLAVLEVDEARDIHEVSLYADGRHRSRRGRVNGILAGLSTCRSRSSAKPCPTSTGWRARWRG